MRGLALLLAFAAWQWPAIAVAGDDAAASPWLREGVALFKHEDYEGARAAFAQAYAVHPGAATVFNLALAELQSGHPVEAAVHFREYLTHDGEPAARLDSVRMKWLPRAEARTARLDVFAPAGADILVDGAVQERAPESQAGSAPMSIVIAAGEHDVFARRGSISERQHVTARGGELVELHFQRVDPSPARPPSAGTDPALPPPEHVESPSHPPWTAIVLLGAAAAVAAGTGVGFGLASVAHANNAQTLRNGLTPANATTECTGRNVGTAYCEKLLGDVQANRREWTLSTAGFVGAGVLGATSLGTWIAWRLKWGPVVARPSIAQGSGSVILSGPW